jgi:hypothetical protein
MEIQETNTNSDNEQNEYIKFLKNPLSSYKEILALKPEKNIYVLMFLGSAANAIGKASSQNMCDRGNLMFVLLTAIFAGGLFGIVSYYIYAALLRWTGKMLKGTADTNKMTTVLAWGSIPIILSLAFTFFEILLTGDAIFKSYPDLSGGGQLLVQIISYINIGLLLWSISLMVVGISVAQNFSIGKSILNLFMPIIVIFIPLLLIIFLRGN